MGRSHNFSPPCFPHYPQLWAYANLEIDPGEDLLRQYVQAAGARLPEFASQNTCARPGRSRPFALVMPPSLSSTQNRG